MTLKRIHKGKAPPGWRRDVDGRCYREGWGAADRAEAHTLAEEDAAPYVEDGMAQLVEWIRNNSHGLAYEGTRSQRVTEELAVGIERGDWKPKPT